MNTSKIKAMVLSLAKKYGLKPRKSLQVPPGDLALSLFGPKRLKSSHPYHEKYSHFGVQRHKAKSNRTRIVYKHRKTGEWHSGDRAAKESWRYGEGHRSA